MRNKSKLTRRKATKSGVFNPSTYHYVPTAEVGGRAAAALGKTLDDASDGPAVADSALEKTTRGNVVAPLVAIIGRPNVGKSSIFNRLTGESKSLVSSVAGTTRDRIYGHVEFEGRNFNVVDTGGLLGDNKDWASDIQAQADVRSDEVDQGVVDGKDEHD